MKRFIAASLVAVLAALALSAPSALAARAAQQPNIVELAAGNRQFSVLVRLVRAAGLVGALSGRGQLTVLAPTNAAFAKVPRATLDALAKDRRALRRVLLYHVIRGAVPARKIVTLRSAPTLAGPKVHIRVSGRSVFVNKAKVIRTDLRASNGIVHVLGGVLIPPN
ncbi:MAG TPA: fasciclin domain-containing protein [Conexibacter sp.]|nr:fasciclin domain-containing protein [Conexibacter sp.]